MNQNAVINLAIVAAVATHWWFWGRHIPRGKAIREFRKHVSETGHEYAYYSHAKVFLCDCGRELWRGTR